MRGRERPITAFVLSGGGNQGVAQVGMLRALLERSYVPDVVIGTSVGALNGSRIRIPGFIVPLENQRGQITEFLLVPYFGACIHTPPPPSNQIIHVLPVKPLKNEQTMDAVWVSGVLETTRSDTGMGSAGYRMKAETVAPYRKP